MGSPRLNEIAGEPLVNRGRFILPDMERSAGEAEQLLECPHPPVGECRKLAGCDNRDWSAS